MKLRWIAVMTLFALLKSACLYAQTGSEAPDEEQWAIHDKNRPQPGIVTPGRDGLPPSDAIILFDGTNLDEWVGPKNQPAKWKIEDGVLEVVPKTGTIRTKRSFGDCQLHIEWATPEKVVGSGQDRGNSGVHMMGLYEVQMLDSYNNKTYSDGQAAAIYAQKPPDVNASRGPGEWQSYDIIFHAPRFEGEELVKPGTITVLHNGVLVQDHWEIKGRTRHKTRAAYRPHAAKLPITLQDHSNPLRFRNIWIRELNAGE